MPTGLAGVGLGPVANKLEGGSPNDPCQHSVHVVEAHPNGQLQCLNLQGELWLPLAFLGQSPRLAGGSNPGSFRITASALSHGACEILFVPLGVESLFPTVLWAP